MCNLLHMNRDDIFEVCELCNFLVPYTYTKYRDPAKLIPIVIFIWLRHHNYLIEWEEIIQYTLLTKKEFKNYLINFYEQFPFECIMENLLNLTEL